MALANDSFLSVMRMAEISVQVLLYPSADNHNEQATIYVSGFNCFPW
jgi:hypothetical protein